VYNMPIQALLIEVLKKQCGYTACELAKLINCQTYLGKASVLRQLHRMVEKGWLTKSKEPGVRPTVNVWRFYVSKNFPY